jgi:hypothetical protein
MPEKTRWIISALVLIPYALGTLWMLRHPSALRDESTANPSPFSFARVQLWWWTSVIVPSWFVVWAQHGTFWPLNETCLALLGIGGATAVAGRMIDAREGADPSLVRHQNAAASQGFFNDILSDENGVSVHRFQCLVFNLAYALSFALTTFQPGQSAFPSFDGSTLALLGVSAGAYIAIKSTENSATGGVSTGATSAIPSSDTVLGTSGLKKSA